VCLLSAFHTVQVAFIQRRGACSKQFTRVYAPPHQYLDQESDASPPCLPYFPAARNHPGHDVVSAALRSQPDTGAAPLTVSDNDIR
jgi:hypothetical protein